MKKKIDPVVLKDFKEFVEVLGKCVEQNKYYAFLYDPEEARYKAFGNIGINAMVGVLEISKIDMVEESRSKFKNHKEVK